MVDSYRTIYLLKFSEDGDAPEKVPESDCYPAGLDGPPYKNNSGDEENIDDSIDMFGEAM